MIKRETLPMARDTNLTHISKPIHNKGVKTDQPYGVGEHGGTLTKYLQVESPRATQSRPLLLVFIDLL